MSGSFGCPATVERTQEQGQGGRLRKVGVATQVRARVTTRTFTLPDLIGRTDRGVAMTGTPGPIALNNVGRLRRARDWSQEALAQRIPVDPSTVSRWERGLQEPDLATQRRLAAVLEVEVEQLGFPHEEAALAWRRQPAALQPQGPTAVATARESSAPIHHEFGASSDPDARHSEVKRREFLEWFFAVTGAVLFKPPLDVLQPIDMPFGQAAQADAITHQYRLLFQSTPAYHLTQPVLDHFRLVANLAREAKSVQSRAALLSSLGQVAQLAGRLSFDRNDYAYAQAYHHIAMQAGDEAESPEVTAYALGCLASISNDCGYPKEALALLQSDRCRPVNALTGPTTQAWLAALEAEAWAILREQTASLQALERARISLDAPTTADTPVWLRFFDWSRLSAYEGSCAMQLGLPEAEASLQHAVASLDPLYTKRRSAVLADLGMLYIRQRRFDQACEVIGEAHELARQTDSLICLDDAGTAEREYRQRADPQLIAHLDERLQAAFP